MNNLPTVLKLGEMEFMATLLGKTVFGCGEYNNDNAINLSTALQGF